MTDTNGGGGDSGMQIDADLVRQLAELLNENDLTEIEVEHGDRRIVVKRQLPAPAVAPAALVPAPAAPSAAASSGGNGAAPASGPGSDEAALGSHPGTVKSPMVGTVYLAGEPGAPPYTSVGARVDAGDTLLIVEAMKVMNPITSPRSGIVTRMLVQDGQPVEYDQPLLVIE